MIPDGLDTREIGYSCHECSSVLVALEKNNWRLAVTLIEAGDPIRTGECSLATHRGLGALQLAAADADAFHVLEILLATMHPFARHAHPVMPVAATQNNLGRLTVLLQTYEIITKRNRSTFDVDDLRVKALGHSRMKCLDFTKYEL